MTAIALILPGEHRCIVDAEEIPRLALHKWCVSGEGRARGNGEVCRYAVATVGQMHRFVLGYDGPLLVDLRVCSASQNAQNNWQAREKNLPAESTFSYMREPLDDIPIVKQLRPADWGRTLTDREFQVMSLIATGHAIHEIAARVHLSASAVSTYKKRVLRKIRGRTDADIALYANRVVERNVHLLETMADVMTRAVKA